MGGVGAEPGGPYAEFRVPFARKRAYPEHDDRARARSRSAPARCAGGVSREGG